MKKMRRILALMLALSMCLGMGIVTLAAPKDVTITVNNADLSKKYFAYQILEATETDNGNMAYILTEGVQEGLKGKGLFAEFETFFTIGQKVNDNSEDVYVTLSEEGSTGILSWLENHKEQLAEVLPKTEGQAKAEDSTVIFNVKSGYYYINTAAGSFITVKPAEDDVVVNDKNPQKPSAEDDFKKVVTYVDGEEVLRDLSSAHIGETVTFRIEFTATNYLKITTDKDGNALDETVTNWITEYTVKDTPKGMDLTGDATVRILAPGAETAEEIKVTGASTDGTTTFTIPWGTITTEEEEEVYTPKYASGSTVTLEYTAVITDEVLKNEDVAENKAVIDYTGRPESETPPEDEVVIRTFSFEIGKIDGDTRKLLEGAKFNLYKLDGETKTLLKFAEKENTYVYDENGTEEIVVNEIEKISGLEAGEYVFLETDAPAGYNKAKDENMKSFHCTLSEDGTWSSPGQVTADENGVVSEDSNGIIVENYQGAELPSTGGIGTTIFYVIGGLLIVGAGILLITKKRMSREE